LAGLAAALAASEPKKRGAAELAKEPDAEPGTAGRAASEASESSAADFVEETCVHDRDWTSSTGLRSTTCLLHLQAGPTGHRPCTTFAG